MQQPTSSVYKRLTWLLLLVVIGLYALHLWYSGQLKDRVASHKAALTETSLRLTEANAGLDKATQTERGLRGDIERLQTTYQAEVQGLKAELETQRTQADAARAAEQRQAVDAYAELQDRFDAGVQRIAALGAEIQDLHRTQVAVAAKHQVDMETAAQRAQARLQEAEGHLNARIADLHMALEGSDPDRAALFDRLQQTLDASHQAMATLEAAKAELGERLTVATATIEQQTQAMADLGREAEGLQAALTQTRGGLAELQARHDAAMDKATMDIAALNAKHDAALDQAAKDAAARQAKSEGDLAQAKAAHTDALGQANSRIQALAADLATVRTEDEVLKVQLTAETAALTALRTEDAALMAKYNAETTAHAALQTKHDTLMAELDAATKAAAEQKTALEQQIADTKGRVADLEQTLATEHKQHEEARAAADQASRAALAYQHDLYARFSDIGAKETAQGMRLRIAETEVQFPVSKATLPKDELPSLDRVARLLTDFPKLTAQIEGHTDASGREETNLALSQARAEAIKQALVTRGIPAERLDATGAGEAKPIGDNATKAGSRLNRRVEIYIVETPK